MNFFKSKKSPQKSKKATRRVSIKTGAIARKLRFDSSLSETEILDWLTEAMENEQYSNISFDEIYFTNDILATCFQAFSEVGKRHRSYWDKLNVEFCRGPVDLVVSTGLVLNCIKHLFLAGDGTSSGEGLVVKVAAALRINISLRSLWILHPLTLEDSRALGEALSINDALDKLSLSGCKWEWPELEHAAEASERSETEASFQDNTSHWTGSESDDGEFLDLQMRNPELAAHALKLPRALATGLQYNKSLRAIDLSSCGLPDEALGIVLTALVGHPTLEVLDVSKNRAGPQTVAALAEILAHSDSNLTELDLREQRKVAKSKKKTITFRRKKTEEEDKVGEAADSGLNIIPLSQAMYNNEMLQILKVSHNQLTDEQVIELVRNLQGNETLQELDLQFNSITAIGLQALTKGLGDLPCLKVLLLGGNDFGKEGTKILAQLEDDDDSVCTILEDGGKATTIDEDDDTFHSARTSNTRPSNPTTKVPSSPQKTKAASRAKAMGGGLMGGLTGISEK